MKRVLIVTYYWPPSGGGGVQRWLKFAKYLPDYGFQPIVLTPANPDFQHVDESLLSEVPSDARVHKANIWEPYSLFRKLSGDKISGSYQQGIVLEKENRSLKEKLFTWIRGNLFIPDPRLFWVRPALRKIKEIVQEEHIDICITTGPPHSMHLIGLKVKKRYRIPWIADLRDPWSDWDMLDKLDVSAPALKLHRRLEMRVFDRADVVLSVSKHWASEIRRKGARRVEVITNGYDPENFGQTGEHRPEKFRISHAGLLNEFRSVPVFWKTLRELCEEYDALNEALEIVLAGMVSRKLLWALKNDPVLGTKLHYRKYIPHADLDALYQSSAALLLVLNDTKNAPGHIPGKLFEYLAAKRPVIGLGPSVGDAADIIHAYNPFPIQPPDNAKGIRESVLAAFDLFQKNACSIHSDTRQYSRKHLTGKLAVLLQALLKPVS